MKKMIMVKFIVVMDGDNPPYTSVYDLKKSIQKGQKENGVTVEDVESPGGPANEQILHFCREEKPALPQPPKPTAPGKILKKLQNYGK